MTCVVVSLFNNEKRHPRNGVWNEQALIASKEIILCEARIDVLTFWRAGYRNVTTSYAVNGFNDSHREAFQKHGTGRVYIAYDRDEAGEKAVAKHAEELMAMGIECFRVQFPKGQDANQYALMTQPAAKEKTPQPSNGNHGEAHTAITDLLTTLDREATEDDEG